MTREQVNSLYNAIVDACPYDSGKLKYSIQLLQLAENQWMVVIGNGDASPMARTKGPGDNSTASDVYAAFTNNSKLMVSDRNNPNYHWLNKAVENWARKNIINLSLDFDEEEDI